MGTTGIFCPGYDPSCAKCGVQCYSKGIHRILTHTDSFSNEKRSSRDRNVSNRSRRRHKSPGVPLRWFRNRWRRPSGRQDRWRLQNPFSIAWSTFLPFFFTVVHSKGICTDFHPKWMKNTALEAVTRVIDRHDVPSVQEYPRGHSGTSHGGLAAARVAGGSKIRFWTKACTSSTTAGWVPPCPNVPF